MIVDIRPQVKERLQGLAGFLMEYDVLAKVSSRHSFKEGEKKAEYKTVFLELQVFESFEGSMLEELVELIGQDIDDLEIIPVKRIDPDDEDEESIVPANLICASFSEEDFQEKEGE